MCGNHKVVLVRWAFHRNYGHFRLCVKGQGEFAFCLRYEAAVRGRREGVHVRNPVLVTVELLVIADLYFLLPSGGDGENPHFEGLVIDLLE